MNYLLIKVLHLVFVTAWFAGLFYLPRIFVNLAQLPPDSPTYHYVLGMSKRLLRFMTIIALPAIVFGLWLAFQGQWFSQGGWLHAKVLLVVLLMGYHAHCAWLHVRFARQLNHLSHRFYRFYNEVPLLFLLAIVGLAVYKPF